VVKIICIQKITPFLWFDNQAEEAANFYVSLFKNSKVKQKTHYTGEEPSGQKGSVMTVSFELDGQESVALNGGPRFNLTEAVRSWSTARRRRRSIITGKSSRPTAVKRCNAAGSRINMVSPGRQCQQVGRVGQECGRGATTDACVDEDEEDRYRSARERV
jgi:3-demethylubiquinone-9 3-methyltransferase